MKIGHRTVRKITRRYIEQPNLPDLYMKSTATKLALQIVKWQYVLTDYMYVLPQYSTYQDAAQHHTQLTCFRI